MPKKTAHFVFAKDSPWLALFNRAIGFNYEYLRRTYRKYYKTEYPRFVKKNHCTEKDDEPEALKPLRINAILGLFVVVCGGLILGGITLMLECVWKRCVKTTLYDVKKRAGQQVMRHKVSLLTFYLEQVDRMRKRQ
ncbi:hypothetical protein AAVH_30108 [Aphelenchoides avenae]|nr:hypothetical protein AAVH_30108 [Aphelenchus avenae]